ncbi:amidohydrolase family protein [Candidatus Latescibacterota bacterium]
MKKIQGLADLHFNGYRGVDFSDPSLTEEVFIGTCRDVLKSGTTLFLPTLVSTSKDIYERNLKLISSIMDMPEFESSIPGFHIEGPFLAPDPGTLGVHTRENIRNADTEFLDTLIEWTGGKIKLLTVSAEIDGAGVLIRHAVSRGITVSLGHSAALEDDLEKAANVGATALTHLGNGIPDMIQRHFNTIWAGLSNDDLSAMIITDGHHLPFSILKSIIRAKGVSRLIVVSDASPLAGMPPGRYSYHDEEVMLENDGLLHNPGRNCLAGSSSTILECMNHLASLKLLSFDEMMQVGFFNPLKLIGIDPKTVRPVRDMYFDGNTFGFRTA